MVGRAGRRAHAAAPGVVGDRGRPGGQVEAQEALVPGLRDPSRRGRPGRSGSGCRRRPTATASMPPPHSVMRCSQSAPSLEANRVRTRARLEAGDGDGDEAVRAQGRVRREERGELVLERDGERVAFARGSPRCRGPAARGPAGRRRGGLGERDRQRAPERRLGVAALVTAHGREAPGAAHADAQADALALAGVQLVECSVARGEPLVARHDVTGVGVVRMPRGGVEKIEQQLPHGRSRLPSCLDGHARPDRHGQPRHLRRLERPRSGRRGRGVRRARGDSRRRLARPGPRVARRSARAWRTCSARSRT